MRPTLVDWIVTPAGQIPEASAAFRSLTGSGFFSDAHSQERNPSDTIQSPSTLRAPKRGVVRRSRTPNCTAASAPRGLASRAAAEPGQRSAGLSPWGAVTSGRTPRRTWRRERCKAQARSPGSRARPGRPGARRRARELPPGARGRGSAAGGGGPSSAAGAAGQAVPVPQHCCAAESARRACLPGHLEPVRPAPTPGGRLLGCGVCPGTLPRGPWPSSCGRG